MNPKRWLHEHSLKLLAIRDTPGAIAGGVAILIRDFRLWLARFKSQVYRRSHRYYWYGRARDSAGRRRRRSYR